MGKTLATRPFSRPETNFQSFSTPFMCGLLASPRLSGSAYYCRLVQRRARRQCVGGSERLSIAQSCDAVCGWKSDRSSGELGAGNSAGGGLNLASQRRNGVGAVFSRATGERRTGGGFKGRHNPQGRFRGWQPSGRGPKGGTPICRGIQGWKPLLGGRARNEAGILRDGFGVPSARNIACDV